MSAIYFHTQHEGIARVSGSERAMMGSRVTQIFIGLLDIYRSEAEEFFGAIITPNHRLRPPVWNGDYANRQRWLGFLETSVSLGDMYGDGPLFQYKGQPLNLWYCQLNTATAIGSEALQFCARMHGQCEVHAYVEGPNRAWLADVIEQGLEDRLLRRKLREFDQGWDGAIALLRKSDQDPVVTSYSVCDLFPSAAGAQFEYPVVKDEDGNEDKDWDAWDELSDEKRWELAIAGIRATNGLELIPENRQFFGDEIITVFDLIDYAYSLQKEK
jgi:hypothetical protein